MNQDSHTTNNQRIAKNTLMLYIRMLLLMCISFYTSRVILQALGKTDFGIYNIVGGVVVLFTFINGAMVTGTQRHLSYELGKEKGDITKIFSACLKIHIWIAIAIFILAETIGLWFVNTKLNLPIERMHAANWVYQLSIVTCALSILRTPYNAAIIAYERMTFYAYLSIVEGVLKLLIVYLLSLASFDRLVYYATLGVIVTIIINCAYYIYCRQSFSEIRFIKVRDRQLYKSLLSFSGWTIFGSIANLARSQGINIVINIFYGVVVNAAIGLANQVNAGINQFVSGFQQAFNPQITKTEASHDKARQTTLINATAKFSYLIILLFAVPILSNLDFILNFWLGQIPEYTKEICTWIVIGSLFDSLSGPLWMTIFATGKIKIYQIVVSIVICLNVPLAYMCGVFNFPPHYAFIFFACINLSLVWIRVFFLKKLIDFEVRCFLLQVLSPIFFVSIIVLVADYFVKFYIHFQHHTISFVVQSIIILLIEVVIIWLCGLNRKERNMMSHYFKSKFR